MSIITYGRFAVVVAQAGLNSERPRLALQILTNDGLHPRKEKNVRDLKHTLSSCSVGARGKSARKISPGSLVSHIGRLLS